jgi:hypothetical protein
MRQHLDALILGAAQPYHSQYNLELQRHRQYDSAPTSRNGQVTSVAPLPARLSSSVTSMTRHLHRTAAKSPLQHRRQHDSVALLPA